MGRIIHALTAAGTTVTNSTAETVTTSATLAANHLQAGKTYKIRCGVRAPTTNSTDTLKGRIRLGPTTLAGTVIGETQAIDVANNDTLVIEVQVYCRSVGSSSVLECTSIATGPDSATTASGVGASVQATPDTTAALLVEATLEWDVSSTGNTAAAQFFTIEEIV